ncbi:MAG: hypothetical protein R3F14_16035 [Polyangiaceae bacterium]
MEIDELRTHLAVAEADARKALGEAATIGRRLLNERASGPGTDASLHTMADRLEVLRHAVQDLQSAHATLRDLAHRSATPDAEADTPAIVDMLAAAPEGCTLCGRTDTLAQVRICTSCGSLGDAAGKREVWSSSPHPGSGDGSNSHRPVIMSLDSGFLIPAVRIF